MRWSGKTEAVASCAVLAMLEGKRVSVYANDTVLLQRIRELAAQVGADPSLARPMLRLAR